MNLSKLNIVLAAEPKYRWAQITRALWQDFIVSWDEASSLPKALRERLAAECPLEIRADIFKEGGRSEKALITLTDGEKIETVLIRQKGKGEASGRNTICLSTQVGCPLGCTFCATGAGGFQRNLTAEEIVEQVVFWGRYLKSNVKQKAKSKAEAKVNLLDANSISVADVASAKIDNVVFMGMGEPFLNYAEFIKAAKFLNDPEKLNIGARRLSVSTVGITEGIKRLAGEKLQINLAISLHAPDDDLRRDLMPVAGKYALKDIFKAVDDYIRKTGRRVMFEYLMIKDINDRDEDAAALVKLMRQPLYFINLIPYNPTGRFQPSPRERVEQFRRILEDGGVAATVRLSFGSSIGAACGQLRGK